MGIGPFESFTFPGVYTQTLSEAPLATVAGDIRFPAFIGVANDTVEIDNFEMIRGSSAMADNPIVKLDVSSQFTGIERDFYVSIAGGPVPIVTGNGSGTTATNPNQVTVYINGVPVPVASVNGTTGQIYLVSYPAMGDLVQVSYFYKNRDTLHTNEDLSDQADSTSIVFRTHYVPIVTGDNGGIASNDPSTVSVVVDGLPATVTSLSGADGQITLSTAPAAGSEVLATYYSNEYPNTYDILPSPYLSSIINVGLAPGSTDFIQGRDYILDSTGNFNTIQWGNSAKVATGALTPSFVPFYNGYGASASIQAITTDIKMWRQNVSGNVDGTNKTFTAPYIPVDGNGRGIVTDNPSDISVYTGSGVADATKLASSEIIILEGSGNLTFQLKTAPDASKKVFVTEYTSLIRTDSWTLTDTTAGASGTGTYTISGSNSGVAMSIVMDASATDVTSILFSPGIGNTIKDVSTFPGKSVVEAVTLTFIDATSYSVVSDVSNGTGSLGNNTGYINQTYMDVRTAFRVTVPNNSAGNPDAVHDFNYQSGDVIVFNIDTQFVTDTSIPTNSIPGINLIVKNTTGGNPGDTAIVNTYNLVGASEPAVGDFYYVSYLDLKQFNSSGLLSPKLYTQEKDVFTDTGPLSVNNKLGFAAHLAFLNGAAAVALCQIERAADGGDAPDSRYIAGIDMFNEPLAGGARPTLMEPVTTSSSVITYLKSSNVIQSGLRYGNEHASYFGFALGTTPTQAQIYAKGLACERMTAVYPDGAVTTFTDNLGNSTEYLVGGEFLAAAVAGRDVSPAFDVAEPLTKKPIVGFSRLFRRLDSVTSAQTANAGITLLEEAGAGIDVKFGLTTDVSSVLTRTPSIIRTKDFIQRGVRSILSPYIGTKLLVQRISEVENTLTSYLASLQQAQIITAFNNVSAKQDPNDPTILNVEAFYSPVFPLLWIVVTFNLRSSV